jgi:hypothetical protein
MSNRSDGQTELIYSAVHDESRVFYDIAREVWWSHGLFISVRMKIRASESTWAKDEGESATFIGVALKMLRQFMGMMCTMVGSRERGRRRLTGHP